MNKTIQVKKSHYEFTRYLSNARWNSVWHQLDEVIRLKPKRVLEVGPGPGIFKNTAAMLGISVETLDLDPELRPDHLGSADALPFDDNTYDVVCAFQMLEHLPYETALKAFQEMIRVSRGHIVFSLPDAEPVWRYLIYLPKVGNFDFSLRRPFHCPKAHRFDGEHYWEINKLGYPLQRVMLDLGRCADVLRTYRVKGNPYHRFFVAKKPKQKKSLK